jgi:hypothetical protein
LPCIHIRWLNVFFFSARNLFFSAAVCLQVLASSVGLFMLSRISITTFSTAVILPLLSIGCLGFAWFCFFQQAFALP